MEKVSVIIPVYNSEKYLEEAVQSVLNQTLKEIEVILINDKSTDQSGEICEKLEQLDSRVKAIHLEENKGLCGARNVGLSSATGEYVAFCDNDDHYKPLLLEDNYRLATEQDMDMVKFGRVLVDINAQGEIIREKESPISQEYLLNDKQEMLKNFFEIKALGVLTNVWNGLYKRSVLVEENIFFDEEMKYGSEDADFSYRFFQKSDSMAINPESYYIHYRRDDFSTSRKYSMNKIESMIKAAKSESLIWDDLDKNFETIINVILAKNNHVINIALYQLFHKDNPMSYSEQIRVLKTIRKKEHMSYSYDNNVLNYMFKNKKKQWLVTYLYSKEYINLLYWVLLLEYKVSGEKW